MAIASLVITLCTTGSGAAGVAPSASLDDVRVGTALPKSKVSPTAAPVCSARKAVRFYRAAYLGWRAKMGAGQQYRGSLAKGTLCPRYLAHVLQRKAHAARVAYERWFEYHWHWQAWLPDKWRRIGICETQLNWQHSNSSYEGAFGFALSSWDAFVGSADRRAGPYPPNAYLATPRQQYEVALAIWRRYGLSGWGCRGA